MAVRRVLLAHITLMPIIIAVIALHHLVTQDARFVLRVQPALKVLALTHVAITTAGAPVTA